MLRTASSRFAASSRVNSSTNCLSQTISAARFAASSDAITGARHISVVSPSTSQLPAMAARSATQSASISTATVRSSRNKNINLAFLPVSVSAVLSQTAQGLLAKQQREVSSRVESSTTSKDLFRNIYFSNDAANVDKEGPQYVEVTQNELRLEFLDASKDYKQTAALMFDDQRESEVPSCFIPRQVENNISHGAGATIVLDKQQVLDYFRSQSANL